MHLIQFGVALSKYERKIKGKNMFHNNFTEAFLSIERTTCHK